MSSSVRRPRPGVPMSRSRSRSSRARGAARRALAPLGRLVVGAVAAVAVIAAIAAGSGPAGAARAAATPAPASHVTARGVELARATEALPAARSLALVWAGDAVLVYVESADSLARDA